MSSGTHRSQIRRGKVPGADCLPPALPPELLGNSRESLAWLLTYPDPSGRAPEDGRLAIRVLFFKRRRRKWRPRGLLSTISKLFLRHLLDKFKTWLEQEELNAEEQDGFHGGRAMTDQRLTLLHLIEKYSSKSLASHYAAFIDLKAAFDSILWTTLWGNSEVTSIDHRLLSLICLLKPQRVSNKVTFGLHCFHSLYQ